MAHCPMCGSRATRDARGLRRCRRHGVLPGPERRDRAGTATALPPVEAPLPGGLTVAARVHEPRLKFVGHLR